MPCMHTHKHTHTHTKQGYFITFTLSFHSFTQAGWYCLDSYIVLLDKLIFRLTSWPTNLIFPIISVFWLLCVALILNVVLSHLMVLRRRCVCCTAGLSDNIRSSSSTFSSCSVSTGSSNACCCRNCSTNHGQSNLSLKVV